jgi:TonB family protein
MPVTEAPTPVEEKPRPTLRPDLPHDPAELHLLIEELEDERDSARWRESAWISVVIHLLLIIFFIIQPKLFPDWFGKDKVQLVQADQLRDQDVRFLALPPDLQKQVPRPKTNIMSDKDRVAQARQPSPDRHTLDELQNARRQGAPGPQRGVQAPPIRQSPPPQPQVAQQQPQQQPAPQQPQQNPNTTAKLENPPQPAPAPNRNVFASRGSASSTIQQAARAAAEGQGQGGEFGAGPISPNATNFGAVDVLSDTMGVDFGPYLARVVEDVRRNWYNLIPEEARSPLYKQGDLAIEFVILKNGSVDGMGLRKTSGDTALDRGAWGGITASNPFPPLPKEFNGPYLRLRFRFYYNPNRRDVR